MPENWGSRTRSAYHPHTSVGGNARGLWIRHTATHRHASVALVYRRQGLDARAAEDLQQHHTGRPRVRLGAVVPGGTGGFRVDRLGGDVQASAGSCPGGLAGRQACNCGGDRARTNGGWVRGRWWRGLNGVHCKPWCGLSLTGVLRQSSEPHLQEHSQTDLGMRARASGESDCPAPPPKQCPADRREGHAMPAAKAGARPLSAERRRQARLSVALPPHVAGISSPPRHVDPPPPHPPHPKATASPPLPPPRAPTRRRAAPVSTRFAKPKSTSVTHPDSGW
eukprot:scaffold26357_cov116-Isochrysis_galbana.AAC.2